MTTIEIEFDRSQVQLNGNHAQITFGVNEIDVDVVDNGSVVAFLNTSVGWTALPGEFMFDETIITGYVRVGYSYVVGQFVLTYSKNGQNLERSDLPDGDLKIVVTSPG